MTQTELNQCRLTLPIGTNITVVIRGPYEKRVCHFAELLLLKVFNELPTDMMFTRKVINGETIIKVNIDSDGLIEILNRIFEKGTQSLFFLTGICVMECNYGDVNIIKEFKFD